MSSFIGRDQCARTLVARLIEFVAGSNGCSCKVEMSAQGRKWSSVHDTVRPEAVVRSRHRNRRSKPYLRPALPADSRTAWPPAPVGRANAERLDYHPHHDRSGCRARATTFARV